jgi:tetratricopeptide (TPR) repeat protein
MNRNDFLNMIEDSGPLDRQTISEVYDLIDIFPYFQSAHLLLLKGLQNNSDIKFENQLKNSSIHIADREVLYYLLKSKPQPVVQKAVLSEVKTEIEETVYDTQQTVIESAKNSEQLIKEIEEVSEEPAGAMLIIGDDDGDDEEKVFYMDPGIMVPDHSDLLELDLETDVSTKQLQSDLIDKFIIANPRIEPNREKSTVPIEDISKPFVEEEGGFFSETLAKIYINQGYYSKAIDIYEKLSLKFPEKSSYFASQIEKVTEYIKK